MSIETTKLEGFLIECESVLDDIFARCAQNAPNFGVHEGYFKNSLKRTLQKYLSTISSEPPTMVEANDF